MVILIKYDEQVQGSVDDHELKELYMHGQSFTQTNERETPTTTKIDHVLISVDWEQDNADCLLHALSTGVSHHAPLHLSKSALFCPKIRFRFDLYLTKLKGYEETMKDAWMCDAAIVPPIKDWMCTSGTRFYLYKSGEAQDR